MKTLIISALAGAVMSLPGPARAADRVAAETAPISVPATSPAFEAIGANPTAVARPTTVRSLGAELLTSIDSAGRFRPGVAIEAAPLWLAFGSTTTLRAWRSDYAKRAMSRFSVSFASIGGADGITDVAQGLRFVLADTADARWDAELERCISRALDPGSAPTDPMAAAESDWKVSKSEAVKQCKTAAAERADVGDSAAVAVAITERQDPNSGRAELGKFAAWLAGGLSGGGDDAHSNWLYMMLSERYTYQALDGSHEFATGAKARVGGFWYGVALNVTWTPKLRRSGSVATAAGVVGADAELRLADSAWLSATMGFSFGSDSPPSSGLFSLLSFKYALLSDRVVTRPNP